MAGLSKKKKKKQSRRKAISLLCKLAQTHEVCIHRSLSQHIHNAGLTIHCLLVVYIKPWQLNNDYTKAFTIEAMGIIYTSQGRRDTDINFYAVWCDIHEDKYEYRTSVTFGHADDTVTYLLKGIEFKILNLCQI